MPARSRRARPTARIGRASRARERWSICSTPASSCGRTRSRTRSATTPTRAGCSRRSSSSPSTRSRAIPTSRHRRCSARVIATCRPWASARIWRSWIAWSRTTSRMGAGRARSPARRASRSSRRTTAFTTSKRPAPACPGIAARARRPSARTSRVVAASTGPGRVGMRCASPRRRPPAAIRPAASGHAMRRRPRRRRPRCCSARAVRSSVSTRPAPVASRRWPGGPAIPSGRARR